MSRVEENINYQSLGVSTVGSNAGSSSPPALPQPLTTKKALSHLCFAPYLYLLQMLKKIKENPFPEQQITILPATPCKQRGRKGSSVKRSLMRSN